MRKINPAVTAGLSAIAIMGAGTLAIVGVDTMVHGDMPVAAAANDPSPRVEPVWQNSGTGPITYEQTTQDYYVFKYSGKLTITYPVTGDQNGHTGPFQITLAIPAQWSTEEYGGQFQSVSLSNSTNMSEVGYEWGVDDTNKMITVKVNGEGMKRNNRIVLDYTLKTIDQEISDDSWFHIAFNAAVDEIKEDLEVSNQSGRNWVPQCGNANIEYTSYGFEMLPDYSQPHVDPSSSAASASIYPGETYETGQFTFTFTTNCAQASLGKPKSSLGTDSSVSLVPKNSDAQNQSWIWTINKPGEAPSTLEVQSGGTTAEQDFPAGTTATINFKVKANNLGAMGKTANITADCYVKGDGSAGSQISGTAAQASTSVSVQSVSVSRTLGSLSTSYPTIGDEVVLPVTVTANGHVPAGSKLRITLSNSTAPAVVIHQVKNLDGTTAATPSSGNWVDVTLPEMDSRNNSSKQKQFNVVIRCGSPDGINQTLVSALSGRTVGINTDVALTEDALKTVQALQSTSPAEKSFTIEAPTAKATSEVTDPSVEVSGENAYSQTMTTNLGDTASFKVTFSHKTPPAVAEQRVMKNVTVSDTLTITNKEGTSLSNETACVDLVKESVVLTKISSDGQRTNIPVTAAMTPSGANQHPYQVDVTPNSTLNLNPGESLELQYNVKMGYTSISASSQSMRGATVTNNPSIKAVNSIPTSLLKTEDTGKASVKVATAQVSAIVNASKDKIARDESTTYVVTVQSVAQKTTASFIDEYAIGLHLTSILDDYSRSFGYQHDMANLKLYYVSSGRVIKEVPTSDYDLKWSTPEEGSNGQKETTFTLDIKESKASSYKIKNVQVSNPNTNKTGGEAVAQGESLSPLSAVSVLMAEANGTASAESTDDVPTDKNGKVDVPAVAKDIKEGFIVTYDGTTKHLDPALAGELPTNTDVLVRADNAGYSVDSAAVTIVGEEIVTPETGWKNTEGGNGTQQIVPNPNNPNGTGTNGTGTNATGTSRNGQYAPLSPTGVSLPVSIAAVITGIVGWAVTKYRKIKRR